mgnify:CR=1 FL=1
MIMAKIIGAALAKAGARSGQTIGGMHISGGKPGTPVSPPGDLEEAIAKGAVHPDVIDELRELEKERKERLAKQDPNDHMHPSMRMRLENGDYDGDYAEELREWDRQVQRQKGFMAADMALGAYDQMWAQSRKDIVRYAQQYDLDWALEGFPKRRGWLDPDWQERLEQLGLHDEKPVDED